MKVEPAVRNETKKIAAGTGILTLVMLLVFTVLGKMHIGVVLGALLGSLAAIGNFFLLGLSCQKVANSMQGVEMPPLPDENEEGDDADEAAKTENAAVVPEIRQAKQHMHLSYIGRMVLLMGVAIVGLTVPLFNPIAAVVPLLFPRLVILFRGVFAPRNKEV